MILLLIMGVLVLVYVLLTVESGRHSLEKAVYGYLIGPSFLGILLLLLYHFYDYESLRVAGRTCLWASVILYVIVILFSLYMLTQPRTEVNTDYSLYLFLIPLPINILLLTRLNNFFTKKLHD